MTQKPPIPGPSQAQLIEEKLEALNPLERAHFRALTVKYAKGKATQGEIDRLAAVGIIERVRLVPGADNDSEPANGKLALTGSYNDLALALARHFAGRLTISIDRPSLCHWRKGRNLPRGAALPPAKIDHRYDTQGWADWIEQWIMPKYGARTAGDADTTGKDIFQLGDEAEARHKMIKEAYAKKELAILEGSHQPVESFRRYARDIGAQINQALIAAEKSLKDRLVESGIVHEKAAELAASICDRQREILSAALTAAVQKTIA